MNANIENIFQSRVVALPDLDVSLACVHSSRPVIPVLCCPVPARRMAHEQICYSDKYFDEHHGYWHVMLPRELSKQVPKTHLMSEEEWRRLGSLGWVHYTIHEPEAHLLRFIRPLPKGQQK
ncbi:cyclin-dependent kinases regulatory subunit 2-like [Eubalaena glacialis]|uniref:cyclin-dependent kinases regulatory subunit 2-like n=1 Tax=Eubalaena glacialis TaxID=27606 RepID=UPI002A5AD2A8|nr:cyclin-dependent kinases regulatory subunit 2-like [Eubalaena glacialis]